MIKVSSSDATRSMHNPYDRVGIYAGAELSGGGMPRRGAPVRARHAALPLGNDGMCVVLSLRRHMRHANAQ